MLGACTCAFAIIRLSEQVCFEIVDRRGRLPGLVGCGSPEAPGPCGAVGLEARGGDVVTGPLAGPVLTGGLVEGAHLEGADAGLDAAVVGRRAGRRVESQDAVLVEQRLRLRGDERRAVVHLEDQGPAAE